MVRNLSRPLTVEQIHSFLPVFSLRRCHKPATTNNGRSGRDKTHQISPSLAALKIALIEYPDI